MPAWAGDDLTVLSLESLLDVTIVGASKYEQKQSEVAAAASVITRQEIKAYGWRTLSEALASLPGVHTTYDRQYTGLGARGFGLPGDLTTRVLVTINGNRVNDPTYDSGPTGGEFPLDVDLIERIEFIPGPGGAVYGQNAMFGVVNVITRRGADVHGGEVAASYQDAQALRKGRVSWGRKFDHGLDVLLSASGLNSSGQDRFYDFGSRGVAGVAAGLDGERDRELFARVARGAWSADLVHGSRRKDDATGSRLSDPLVRGQFIRDVYTLAQLQYAAEFADDTVQVTGRLFAGEYRFRTSQSYGTVLSSPAEGSWRGTEWRVLSTALAQHKLMLGVEAQDNLRNDQAALSPADPTRNIRLRNSGWRVGMYAQDEWHFADRFTATLGARVDRNDATGTDLSPRAALIWQAATATTVKALYGRAHRAPNVYEREFDDGVAQVRNPMLQGERVDTLELVADHRMAADLALRMSVYEWTLHGLIAQGIDRTTGLSQFQSGGKITARGIEWSADKTFAFGARVRGSVSSQHVSRADGQSQPNSPTLLGKLNALAPLPWWGLHAGYELHADSKRRAASVHAAGGDIGGYALSNLTLRTDALAPGLELSVGIYNLFDKRYAHPGASTNWQRALEQDSRTVRLALSCHF